MTRHTERSFLVLQLVLIVQLLGAAISLPIIGPIQESCDPAKRGIECILPPILYNEYIAVQGIIRNLPVRF